MTEREAWLWASKIKYFNNGMILPIIGKTHMHGWNGLCGVFYHLAETGKITHELRDEMVERIKLLEAHMKQLLDYSEGNDHVRGKCEAILSAKGDKR